MLGEGLLVDDFGQAQVEQPDLLLHEQGLLPLKLGTMCERLGLGVAGLRRQNQAVPVAHLVVFLLPLVEDGKHLRFEIDLAHSDAGMVLAVVLSAAVIDVPSNAFLCPFLD